MSFRQAYESAYGQVFFLPFAGEMRVISRVLSSGMEGADVRELHEDLERLGYFIPPAESRIALFGPATRKTVLTLQRACFAENRVTGIVDQATANLISSEVRNRR